MHMPLMSILDLIPGFPIISPEIRYAVVIALAIGLALIAGKFYDEPVRAWLWQRVRAYRSRDAATVGS